jgi:hypothetical protein
MTEITPSFIYWITRLNGINVFLGIIMTLSIIAIFIFLIGMIVTKLEHDVEEYGIFKKYLLTSTYIFIPITILFILTPTTKEACAIYVVPKIVNNEKVQNIGQEFYDLALDWMKELHPKRKSLENKETSK